MKQVAFTEVRNHAKTWFDMVESGETLRVLRNGKPIADIEADVFISADQRQRDAAARAGLRVEEL